MTRKVGNDVRTTAPLSSAEILTKIEQRATERDEAAKRAEGLRAATADKVLTATNEELDQHETAIRNADRDFERAQRFIELLEAELQKAEEREEQVRRRELYSAGLRANEETERLIQQDYPAAAAAVVKIMTRLQGLEKVIGEANASRPKDPEKGEGLLPLIEFEGCRASRGEPAWSEEIDETFYVDKHGAEISFALYDRGGRTTAPKTRRKIVHHPVVPAQHPLKLRETVNLPAAKIYDEAFWPPKNH